MVEKRNRVLLVDDDEGLREMFDLLFKVEDVDALILAQGGDICSIAIGFKPDVIILDYLLARQSGVDLAKALRANVKTAHIPLILLTGLPDFLTSQMGNSFDLLLGKPFEVDDLFAAIRDLAQKKSSLPADEASRIL
ncbi:two-component system response regulator [Pedobacter sp. SYP-B3415]|uniref:response regulator n=1 Tax=Pedobacter sp. SYP-B3415 TaxID=2496641 RepID=UPI00101E0060|nr:response regulator [Pedobacter sp. SYP-B3415]